MLEGFDIRKKPVTKDEAFPELQQFSKTYFWRTLLIHSIWLILIHTSCFFALHFWYFRTPTDDTALLFSTMLNSGELLTTNLITALYLSNRYFFASLFRERHDYGTINAWYILICIYAGIVGIEVLLFSVKMPLLLIGTLAALFVSSTLAHLLALLFQD